MNLSFIKRKVYQGVFKNNRPFFISFLLIFCTCSNESPMMGPETFNNADRPFFSYNNASDYYLCKPWNYEKEINKDRSYPLVVYLHGWGSAGNISSLNYLGYDTENGTADEIAKKFQTNYPSFVLVPQSNDDEWDASKVIAEIEDFKSKYRIDTTRIYLIGYSMGGSGSYILANAYYDFNGQLFAGIIRLAGQSQTSLREPISQNTSVWLHIGLEDTQLRIDITREAYNFLKTKHPEAVEISSQLYFNGMTGTTLSLKKGNTEIAKKTEYNQIGHGIDLIPFENEALIRWLFEQKL